MIISGFLTSCLITSLISTLPCSSAMVGFLLLSVAIGGGSEKADS